ncbi:MAG: RCC1 domain-containing protein, partial [Rhodoglobus sp.]
MSTLRIAGTVALSALIVAAGGGAIAVLPSLGSGPTAGGTNVTDTLTGVTFDQTTSNSDFSLALGSDGRISAWGSNQNGKLGINSTSGSLVPVEGAEIVGLKYTHISAGDGFALAIGNDGKTYAWGLGAAGQLGTNSTNSSNVPIPVTTPAGVKFTKISAGDLHALALGTDGNVYTWGWNYYGQQGLGTSANSLKPELVIAAPQGVTVTDIEAGAYGSYVSLSNGETYSWGRNDNGQLGNNSTVDSNIPVLVQTPTGVKFTQISSGANHSLALGDDGETYAWGQNLYEQLGDYTTVNRLVPVLVSTPVGVHFTELAAGDVHSLALGDDDNVYSWGQNFTGQLG